MTERKPPEISFTSWIDRQINEAAERGAFDNLPGAGKPLPKRSEEDAAQAWLREYLRREGVPSEELLPTPLKLRKEIERLTESVQDLRSEQQIRDVAADLNRRILEWRRIPVGPPLFLPLVDADTLVSRWRDAQRAATEQRAPLEPLSPGTPPKTRPRRPAWPRLRRARRARWPGSPR
jgi:hypothetical protein